MSIDDIASPERRPDALPGTGDDPVLLHPDDVLGHAGLSLADKRARLAAWASDARAVEGAPGLRQLDNGAIVRLDDILAALRALDAPASGPARCGPVSRPASRRSRRWLSRWSLGAGRRDDDDDPPPCPAVIATARPLLQIAA